MEIESGEGRKRRCPKIQRVLFASVCIQVIQARIFHYLILSYDEFALPHLGLG